MKLKNIFYYSSGKQSHVVLTLEINWTKKQNKQNKQISICQLKVSKNQIMHSTLILLGRGEPGADPRRLGNKAVYALFSSLISQFNNFSINLQKMLLKSLE